MARIIGAVDFSNGKRLYLFFDRTTDIALRPLFATEQQAERWDEEQSIVYVEPANAVTTEEEVRLLKDLAFDGNDRFVFPTRASAKAMWLTGPRSVCELWDENDRISLTRIEKEIRDDQA